MRIAIAGKGGTGKTTISGILCRALARRGRSVLAIDADSNPNLASILGARGDADVPALSRDLLERVEEPDGTRRLVLTRPIDEIIAEYAGQASDDVRLVVMERVGHGGAG